MTTTPNSVRLFFLLASGYEDAKDFPSLEEARKKVSPEMVDWAIFELVRPGRFAACGRVLATSADAAEPIPEAVVDRVLEAVRAELLGAAERIARNAETWERDGDTGAAQVAYEEARALREAEEHLRYGDGARERILGSLLRSPA